jgi:hypothetical protein
MPVGRATIPEDLPVVNGFNETGFCLGISRYPGMLLQEGKFRTDEKVLVKCDFGTSPKCKGTYLKVYKNVVKGRGNNDGRDRCIYCFNSSCKAGKDSHHYKYEKDETYFDVINSDVKAYLLGWLAGDGHLKKDGLYLSIHSKDREILELFRRELNSNAPVRYREYDHTVNWGVNSVKLVTAVCKQLDVSVGKKSHKISLPRLSRSLTWAYLRGLFDSDGSVCSVFSKKTSPSCNISSMSKQLKTQIYELSTEEGIKSCVTRTMVHFWGQGALDFMSKLYEGAEYFLHRKQDMYVKWSSWKPYRGTIAKPRKVRSYYPPPSPEHRAKISEANRRRKGIRYKK